MSKKSINIKHGEYLFSNVICNLNKLPFSFTYNNKKYNFAKDYQINKIDNEKEIINEYSFIVEDTLKITFNAKFNKEFGECEYYAYIENISDNISSEISNLISLDMDFNGNNPILRGNYGDLVNYYAAYENDLNHGDIRFLQSDGRSCHIVFPYFDLCYGNGGMLIALGWGGTWEALFTSNGNDNTKVIAKNCVNMNACLLPKEKIRTALVVLLPYNGRNEDFATNLWREWYVKYNMPKMNDKGDLITPFSTCMLANDTGKPNSDGSVSEDNLTWKPSIDKLIKEDLVTDFRWIDAGWYATADKTSSESDWWGSVGAWEVDKAKWPNGSLKESVEYCHNINMKTFIWFEPERVSHIEGLVNNYDYKKEWVYETSEYFYNNIGNKDCLNWTLNRIIKVLDDNNIDMYREDNNFVIPKRGWDEIDKKEQEIYKVSRKGINENKCVLAHYELLDNIVKYQKERNKCHFVDICAGGGGRNDIESLRRGIPIMRSDIDRGGSSMRISQSSTLCKWIVFHGSSTKETDASYKLLETKGATPYVARASYLPIFNLNEAFTKNTNLDYDRIRRNFNEWKSINHLLSKDFYRLTPFHHNTNKTQWSVFCYNDENINESILLGFRMENANDDTYLAKLPYVNEEITYEIYNVDTNETLIVKGSKLLNEGIKLHLDNPKTSVLLKIKQK